MAEQDELPPEVAEDEVVSAEDVATADPIAELAGELGWKPQDKWEGDPEKWRPAADFLRAGRDMQRSATEKLKSIETQVERFARIAEEQAQEKIRERDAYWQQQLDKAVDEGDHDLKKQAVEQLRKPAPQNAPPPETSEWIARNPWFNSDPLAASRAQEVTERLSRQGYDTATQLREAERAIRKEFPEHFPKPKDPPAMQTGQARNPAPSNRAKGFADMPPESQRMAKDMHERNGVPLETIAKSYWADVARQKGA